MSAKMTNCGAGYCQVCVPQNWSDGLVIAYAEQEYPCETKRGWHIRRDGDPLLDGDPERVQCISRPDHVHIMLDA
jgi:hypothetical protein